MQAKVNKYVILQSTTERLQCTYSIVLGTYKEGKRQLSKAEDARNSKLAGHRNEGGGVEHTSF